MVEFVKGDILRADAQALINTVNTVGVMGKGIALQFKRAYPENFRAYVSACKQGEVRIGRIFVHDLGRLDNPRYILNFPTKKHWRGVSRIQYIEKGLEDLVRVIHELQIESLAIPPLGCGHGELRWPTVRACIEAALANLAETRILVFEPAGAPPVDEMTIRTKRPRMTQSRAAILSLMNKYAQIGYDLSILEVQKLAYFLQVAGEPLRLSFRKHHYGPYADKLRHTLNDMEGHYILGDGNGNLKPTASMRILNGAAREAGKFLAHSPATRERLDRIAGLVEGFETPYGMELLASTHWVASRDLLAKADAQAALSQLAGWNKRKKNLFRPEDVSAAWTRLKQYGWI